MLTRIWQRFRNSQERADRLKDEAAIEKTIREHEEPHGDGTSEADKLPPAFKNTDWTFGGPP
jgi:hypothetical protein